MQSFGRTPAAQLDKRWVRASSRIPIHGGAGHCIARQKQDNGSIPPTGIPIGRAAARRLGRSAAGAAMKASAPSRTLAASAADRTRRIFAEADNQSVTILSLNHPRSTNHGEERQRVCGHAAPGGLLPRGLFPTHMRPPRRFSRTPMHSMHPFVARVLPRHSQSLSLASRADLCRRRCGHTARQKRAGRRSWKAPGSTGRACRAELHCIVVRAAGVALLDAWPHLQAAVRLLVKAAPRAPRCTRCRAVLSTALRLVIDFTCALALILRPECGGKPHIRCLLVPWQLLFVPWPCARLAAASVFLFRK